MRLGDPIWLNALWLTPVALVLLAMAYRSRVRAMARFADARVHTRLNLRRNLPRTLVRTICVALSFATLSVALARPQWNPQPQDVERSGRDVVFLIDVSRSMLARDLAPSRLDRTKLWIKDLAPHLRGDRVGIVAFAGSASVVCPLTQDYRFFSQTLDELSPRSVPRGGTNIGDGIRKVLNSVFRDEDDSTHFRDIILITDGEDQESLPVEAAQQAADRAVRIIALGIGSEHAGATIPTDSGAAMRYQGQDVQTQLDAETLEQIAGATPGGVFLKVGTGTINLDEVYEDLIRSAQQASLGTASTILYDEGFLYFLIATLILLSLEGVIRA
ncbi:MAG: VWA domain-containing protein [Phycisphaerales bacterium JB043]